MIKDIKQKVLYLDILGVCRKIQAIIKSNSTYNITSDLINNKISLDIGTSFLSSLNYNVDDLPFLKKKAPVITLDSQMSPDLDSAFSIRKERDLYYFDVYVTDTPSFLAKNKELSINAYKQGTSFYLRETVGKNINYDMLPKNLSHSYLSMLKNEVKNAICFRFIFKEDGNLEECKVTRNKVKVDCNLFRNDALKVLENKKTLTLIDRSIFLLQELTEKVALNSDKYNLYSLRRATIDSMVAFPSVLVNYYLASHLEFGIYYDKSSYTMKSINTPYLRAGAPLRRYADDINLAIFLQQENLQKFERDDFLFLENNLDEIIAHLNCQNTLAKYIDNNNELVKKYYLKRD